MKIARRVRHWMTTGFSLGCPTRGCHLSQVVLEIARLIREDFLQQNAFTDYDYTCPLYKSLGMLKVMASRQSFNSIPGQLHWREAPPHAWGTWVRSSLTTLSVEVLPHLIKRFRPLWLSRPRDSGRLCQPSCHTRRRASLQPSRAIDSASFDHVGRCDRSLFVAETLLVSNHTTRTMSASLFMFTDDHHLLQLHAKGHCGLAP